MFIEELKARFESASFALGSSPLEPDTKLGPLVDKAQFDHVMDYIKQGKKDGQLIIGGKRKGTKGWFVEPTIFLNPPECSKICQEEIFGPVLIVKTFRTEEEVIALANNTDFGLSGMSITFLPFVSPYILLIPEMPGNLTTR